MLKDMSVSGDGNVTQKEAEETIKHKSSCIEVQRMWNVQCKIIPPIVAETRVVRKF
jgi:hypothetical protein